MTDSFVYFGTPEVAQTTLLRLIEAGSVPALVVTGPDRPQGRGLALTPSPVKMLALKKGIPVTAPEKVRDAMPEILSAGATFAIVVAYGKILPEALINAFPKGILNVHYSLLPKYRGASPVEAALLNDDSVTGVTVQKMAFALDAGAVLAAREEAILPTDTALTLRPRLTELGAQLLIESLPRYLSGDATLAPQDESRATHSGKIAKEARELNLAGDAQENWNKYRAYAEGPGTHFFLEENGKRIRMKVKRARLENGSFVVERVIPEGKKETDYSSLAQ